MTMSVCVRDLPPGCSFMQLRRLGPLNSHSGSDQSDAPLSKQGSPNSKYGISSIQPFSCTRSSLKLCLLPARHKSLDAIGHSGDCLTSKIEHVRITAQKRICMNRAIQYTSHSQKEGGDYTRTIKTHHLRFQSLQWRWRIEKSFERAAAITIPIGVAATIFTAAAER